MKVQTKQEASSIGPDRKSFKRKTENIFLSINLKGCFGCSKNPVAQRPKTYSLLINNRFFNLDTV